jgi:hypothetical protein
MNVLLPAVQRGETITYCTRNDGDRRDRRVVDDADACKGLSSLYLSGRLNIHYRSSR